MVILGTPYRESAQSHLSSFAVGDRPRSVRVVGVVWTGWRAFTLGWESAACPGARNHGSRTDYIGRPRGSAWIRRPIEPHRPFHRSALEPDAPPPRAFSPVTQDPRQEDQPSKSHRANAPMLRTRILSSLPRLCHAAGRGRSQSVPRSALAALPLKHSPASVFLSLVLYRKANASLLLSHQSAPISRLQVGVSGSN